jgi:hypothetical protein
LCSPKELHAVRVPDPIYEGEARAPDHQAALAGIEGTPHERRDELATSVEVSSWPTGLPKCNASHSRLGPDPLGRIGSFFEAGFDFDLAGMIRGSIRGR